MASSSLQELGFSKINIGLAITGKRPDGYHNIDTIFQAIHLGDSIYFAPHHSVVFSGSAPELPDYMQNSIPYDESNLAVKALRAVQDYTGCKTGAAIHLLKRVPPAAGLGGGSGDVVTMIRGLNKFWDLRLTENEIHDLAVPLGADVAFFLRGGLARGTGIGEVLEPLPDIAEQWLLLVKPKIEVSTALAYKKFSGNSQATSKMIDKVIETLRLGEVGNAFSQSKNTFEELLFPDWPELEKCKDFFLSRGFNALMSGSGPTMVIHLERALDAIKLQEEIAIAGHDWLTLISKTAKTQ